MKEVFADTWYWVALHDAAGREASLARKAVANLGNFLLVTTDEVLSEYLTFLGAAGWEMRRQATLTAHRCLRGGPVLVEAQSRASFLGGLGLYQSRLDKSYSLTDCISMTTMRRRQIREALTNDHHFEQEGFRILVP